MANTVPIKAFYSQAQTLACFIHLSGEPTHSSLLLTQNPFPKDIAGSDMMSREYFGQEGVLKEHRILYLSQYTSLVEFVYT